MQKFTKALFIGINYHSLPDNHLENCINDALNMQNLVKRRCDYGECRVLVDTNETPKSNLPTKVNIFRDIKWLLDVPEGSHIFMHYSGHGGSVRDTTRKESDGKNETLCNLDFMTVGEIIDDELNQLVVKTVIEKGIHLTCITDSCHSGSNMDERFSMKESNNQPQPKPQGYPQHIQPMTQPMTQPMIQPMSQIPQQMVPQQMQLQGYPQQMQLQGYPQSYPQPMQQMQPPKVQYLYQGKWYSQDSFNKLFVKPLTNMYTTIQNYNRYLQDFANMSEYDRMKVSRSRDVSDLESDMNNIRKQKNDPFVKHMLKYNEIATPVPEATRIDPDYVVTNFELTESVNRSLTMNASRQLSRQASSNSFVRGPLIVKAPSLRQLSLCYQSAGLPAGLPVGLSAGLQAGLPVGLPAGIYQPLRISTSSVGFSRNFIERVVSWSSNEDTNMPRYTGKGSIVKISGCRDEQTSADGYNGRENGALSGCLLTILERSFDANGKPLPIKIGELLYQIRQNLAKNRFEQVPQVCSNDPLDPNQFINL